MRLEIESYCGLECSKCEYGKSGQCKGCIESKGQLGWGKCEIAFCAMEKGRRFCGECSEIPCEKLKKFSYDKEFGDNGGRIEHCQQIKAQLVKEAREGTNPVSVCGHHCDYCFMGKWCGGCRSTYNCCSFATISENGKCPNVKCAEEKKICGCYECDELDSCEKGYYAQKNEYVAKAAAVFIRKYGSDVYTKALRKAIEQGENYPESFDKAGSVSKAVEIFEKYL